uniref:Uncharacterized protein n=1 Tax=Arundo donax TaxID=35708 RepID=A0A0A8ZKC2_ARUDO
MRSIFMKWDFQLLVATLFVTFYACNVGAYFQQGESISV